MEIEPWDDGKRSWPDRDIRVIDSEGREVAKFQGDVKWGQPPKTYLVDYQGEEYSAHKVGDRKYEIYV